MPRFSRTLGWVVLFLSGCAVGLPPLSAAEVESNAKNEGESSATLESSLREAISDEIVGDDAARDAKLDALIESHLDASTPRWLRGYIKTEEGWKNTVSLLRERTKAENSYRELREKVADDLAGNRQLARFCKTNKLNDIAQGHWRRILDFDTNDLEARKALGHVPFDSGWATKADAERVLKGRKEYNASMANWSKKIPPWINDLRSADAKRKEAAKEKLLAIRDAAAVPILNAALAYRNDEETKILLEILCQIPEMNATQVLTEQGIVNQSPQVLRIVSDELRNRDDRTYVPQLLMGLSSPVTSEMELHIVPGTRQVLYRHVFVRERQFDKQLQGFGSDYGQAMSHHHRQDFYDYAPFDDPDDEAKTRARAAQDLSRIRKEQAESNRNAAQANNAFMDEAATVMATAMMRERQKAVQNMTIEETNGRIALLLSKVFDVNHGLPEQWWKWWNQRHEIQQASQKPVSTQFQYRVSVDQFQTQSYEQTFRNILSRYHSCFVAGTPVATPQGLRPIESLKTGDLVLAQSIETGEIAFKAVVRPTIRPKCEVNAITIGDETFVCTLKHPFWKTGTGWVWAKDLKVGDLVRTSQGPLPVASIEKKPDASVYNLVVADFGTYFVGKTQTLTHDITFRVPTLAIAPGVFPEPETVEK